MSSKAKPPGSELNFEKAMTRLEAIVEQMETGKLPLEELIVRYEEGMNLVKVCQDRLTSAEQKIEIIARNDDRLGESAFIQNFARFDAQIRQVSRVQSHAGQLMALFA